MTAQLTYEERLGRIDQEVGELQQGFIEAVEHLRRAPEADGSFEDRWEGIAQRMKDLRGEIKPEDFDKYVRLKPDDPRGHFALGAARFYSNRLKAALTLIDQENFSRVRFIPF